MKMTQAILMTIRKARKILQLQGEGKEGEIDLMNEVSTIYE